MDAHRREAASHPLALHVNGRAHRLAIDPRMTLLDLLRDELGLTGTKRGCDHGTCGACTVIRDGQAIYACLALAAACEGAQIETAEGLDTPGEPHPLVAAFVARDALQCGFCTPGQVMAAKALLATDPAPSEAAIAAGMCGNLCRCGAYVQIREAVRLASGQPATGSRP